MDKLQNPYLLMLSDVLLFYFEISSLKLDQGNEAAAITIHHAVTTRRPRDYALSAAGTRDLVAKDGNDQAELS